MIISHKGSSEDKMTRYETTDITNQEFQLNEDNEAHRSQFLFLYDTRMANPNGDPDENRPRIDPYSGKNLVTEYRLKRTIRDYIASHYNGSRDSNNKIFMREELNLDGTRKQIEDLAVQYITTAKEEVIDSKGKKHERVVSTIDRNKLTKEHIDVRLFGLMFLVKKIHFKKLGPVQFSIGQSLNKVQEILIRNVRVVPTKKDAKSGTFGEKSVLKYSLILFHGFLNQFAAKAKEEPKITEEDVEKMMLGMWHGTNDLNTSSKFGQVSRLLLRVIYSDENAYIGDIDKDLILTNSDIGNIEDISQADIDVSKLISTLTNNKKIIKKIQFACHDNLEVCLTDSKEKFLDIIVQWAKDNKVDCQNILSR